jgi:hypothetical protein
VKPNAILVVTSLLSILLLTLHITDDIVRGISMHYGEIARSAGGLGGVTIILSALGLLNRRRGQPTESRNVSDVGGLT